jgi:hypothetical protein
VAATRAAPRLGVFDGRFRACFAGLAEQLAASGAAYFPAGVCASQLACLLEEAGARPFRPAPSRVGAVRQRAELAVFNCVGRSRHARRRRRAEGLVASRASRFGGQAFAVNELTLMRCRGRGAGIGAHRDHARYRLLIVVLSLQGSARLAIVADRAASRPLASCTAVPATSCCWAPRAGPAATTAVPSIWSSATQASGSCSASGWTAASPCLDRRRAPGQRLLVVRSVQMLVARICTADLAAV